MSLNHNFVIVISLDCRLFTKQMMSNVTIHRSNGLKVSQTMKEYYIHIFTIHMTIVAERNLYFCLARNFI